MVAAKHPSRRPLQGLASIVALLLLAATLASYSIFSGSDASSAASTSVVEATSFPASVPASEVDPKFWTGA